MRRLELVGRLEIPLSAKGQLRRITPRSQEKNFESVCTPQAGGCAIRDDPQARSEGTSQSQDESTTSDAEATTEGANLNTGLVQCVL